MSVQLYNFIIKTPLQNAIARIVIYIAKVATFCYSGDDTTDKYEGKEKAEENTQTI